MAIINKKKRDKLQIRPKTSREINEACGERIVKVINAYGLKWAEHVIRSNPIRILKRITVC